MPTTMRALITYWRRVLARAWKDTLVTMELSWGKIIRNLVIFLLASGLLVAAGHTNQAGDRMHWQTAVVVAGVGLFAVVFLWHFLCAPHRLDLERVAELSRSQPATAAAKGKTEQLEKLKAHFRAGQKLLADASSYEGSIINRSSIPYRKWDQEVMATLQQSFSAEAFMFESIAVLPRTPGSFLSTYGGKKELEDFMNAKLNKLRQIVGRAENSDV